MMATSLALAQDTTTSGSGVAVRIVTGILLGTAMYCVPSIIALLRKHPQKGAIIALNILVGWTFVGWIIAFVWALTNQAQPTQVIVQTYPPPPGYYPTPEQSGGFPPPPSDLT